MLSTLTSEHSYAGAMNGVLEMMSMLIHTDRMSIFECGGDKTTITFERRTEEVPSLLGVEFDLPRWAINKWFGFIGDKPVALVPDTDILVRYSKPLHEWCVENGIKSLMAAPFFNDGEIVGFLGAYNAHVYETVDLNRLFAAVSAFIGARIENRRLIDRMAWASEHDVLTDLYDRRGSEQAIKRYRTEHPDAPYTLILIDLDNFKSINDVLGHTAGDEALKAAADVMREVFPKDAILCRNGGDEFLVALLGEAAQRADELVEQFSNMPLEYECDGERRQMTASVGYAQFPDQTSSVRNLYNMADAALYAVKLAGKAGFSKYTPEAASHYRSHLGFTANTIMEGIPLSLIVHKRDENHGILFASNAFCHLLGCDDVRGLIRLSGGSSADLVHPDDRKRVFKELTQLATAGENAGGLTSTLRLRSQDGAFVNVSATSYYVNIPSAGEAFYSLVVPA